MNRAIEEKDLTQSLALYISKHGNVSSNKFGCWIDKDPDYVRVSEPMEVTFTPLADEVVLEARVASIDGQIEKTRAELTRKVNDLTDQKNRLLAITHES